MTTIGAGVRAIRVRDANGAFRVIYIATLAECSPCVHAFANKTPATSERDLDLATARFRD